MWPVLDPGKLSHRIQIQGRTKDKDAFGETEKWTTKVETWASIIPLRGVDLIRAGIESSHTLLTISIYWQPGVTPDMRVLWGSRVLQIDSIVNVEERNVVLELNCTEIYSASK